MALYIEEQTLCNVKDGAKYWSCRICDKQNRKKRDIKSHIEAAHVNVSTSPYSCPHCLLAFKTRRSLHRHESSVHK